MRALDPQLGADVNESVHDAVFEAQRLREAGFEQSEFGELIARGATVNLYHSCGQWEVEISLPSGCCLGFDVPRISTAKAKGLPDD